LGAVENPSWVAAIVEPNEIWIAQGPVAALASLFRLGSLLLFEPG
jgi:hypothetical protein